MFMDRETALLVEGTLVELVGMISDRLEELQADGIEQSEEFAEGIISYHNNSEDYCQAIGVGMEEEISEEMLEDLEQRFIARSLPARTTITPFTDPGFARLLQDRGWRIETWMNVLVCPLDEEEEFEEGEFEADGVEVREIDPEEFGLWARTIAEAFTTVETGAASTPEYYAWFEEFDSARMYMGYVNGKVAGAGVLVMLDDVVFLSGAGTLEEFRRKGVQTVLLRRRMEDAIDEGATLALFLSVPGSPSQRNAERLGFEVAYTRVYMKKSLPEREH
ncbi:GNAT family N-acetyltransferase [bacterium]|nr:GNAT family N-acetyltransferase [bacterium]